MRVRPAIGVAWSSFRCPFTALLPGCNTRNKGGVVDFPLTHPRGGAIATLGYMPNDVMMFDKSGLSIAMGNASPEV